MITQIFNTLNRVDAKRKQGTVLLDKDISVTVLIDINNTQTKWTDNEKGYIVDEIYKKHFNGTLKDCLTYLEPFCLRPSVECYSRARVDLNEMYHEYNDNL